MENDLAPIVLTTFVPTVVLETTPPLITIVLPTINTAPTIATLVLLVLPAYPIPSITSPGLDFLVQKFKHQEEHVHFTLDIHGVAWVLLNENSVANIKAQGNKNKVCCHAILATLFDELFDVYCAYKEAKVV